MIVEREGITIEKDNHEQYFTLLIASIESVDEFARLTIYKAPTEYKFRVVPSDATYVNVLIKTINDLNNLLGIRVTFAKSIKNSASITFNINI